MTRFRGMISTQPGSTPMASFKVVSLEEFDPQQSYIAGNDFGKILKYGKRKTPRLHNNLKCESLEEFDPHKKGTWQVGHDFGKE